MVAFLMAAGFVAGGCDNGGAEGEEMVLAEAAGETLTAGEMTSILANAQVPPNPQVYSSIARLWGIYAGFQEVFVENPTLEGLKIEPYINLQRNQEALNALREQMVRVDTTVTEEKIQAEYEQLAQQMPEGALPPISELRPQLEQAVRQSAQREAEVAYVEGVKSAWNFNITERAAGAATTLLEDPEAGTVPDSLTVATFRDSAFTAGDLREMFSVLPEPQRQQILEQPDGVESFVEQILEAQLLVRVAESEGIVSEAEPDEARRDFIREIRSQIEEAGISLDNAEGDSDIIELMRGIASQQSPPLDLGPLAEVVKKQHPVTVHEEAIQRYASVRQEEAPATQPRPEDRPSGQGVMPLPEAGGQ